MHRVPLIILSLFLLSCTVLGGIDFDEKNLSPRLVKTIDIPNCAFLRLVDVDGKKNLVVSTFQPKLFVKGAVQVYSDVNDVVFGDGSEPATVANVHWPNEVNPVVEGQIEGVKNGLLIGGGFLVPTHTNGAVTLVVMNEGTKNVQTVQLTTVKKGFFYHRAVFKDMNGDGRMDIITARATKPVLFGNSYGELLWLENPGKDALKGAWKEHVIASGNEKAVDGSTYSSPDVYFRLVDFDKDNKDELVASVFFQESLDIMWNIESNPTGMKLDDSVGPAFSVDAVDLNNDGKNELLLSNHMNEEDKSSLWAYEMIGDPKTPAGWKRHTLASGFKTIAKGKGQASPGGGVAFHPKVDREGRMKPWIALAGDGAMAAYLLTPKSEDHTNWEYDMEKLDGATGVVGEIAVDDVNGDGYNEVFVPDYDNGHIYVYTFAPSA